MLGFAADCLGNFRQNTSPHQTMPYISAMLASASNHFVANSATLVKDDIEATPTLKLGYLYQILESSSVGTLVTFCIPSKMHVTSTS